MYFNLHSTRTDYYLPASCLLCRWRCFCWATPCSAPFKFTDCTRPTPRSLSPITQTTIRTTGRPCASSRRMTATIMCQSMKLQNYPRSSTPADCHCREISCHTNTPQVDQDEQIYTNLQICWFETLYKVWFTHFCTHCTVNRVFYLGMCTYCICASDVGKSPQLGPN